MTGLNLTIKFNDSYYKKLGLKGEGYETALDNAITHTLSEAENIMKREAPIDTGNLRRSTHKFKQGKLSGGIRNNARSGKNRILYWQFVQFGTSKMNANPFVTRTVRRIQPKIKDYFHEELVKMGVL